MSRASGHPGIVKVCGVTTPRDAEMCAAIGVDWIGVNFLEGSPRRIDEARALAIARALGGRARLVGLCRVAEVSELEALRGRAGLDLLQLYGEPEAGPADALGLLESFAFFAVPVAGAADAERARRAPGRLVVVDAKSPGKLGGTGRLLDVELARPVAAARRVLLAGGLAPENVAARIDLVRPFGVDVASGVERSPGVKDEARLLSFVEAARGAFSALGLEAEPGERPPDGLG